MHAHIHIQSVEKAEVYTSWPWNCLHFRVWLFYQLSFLFVNSFNGPPDNLVIISEDFFWEELRNLAQINGAALKEKKSSIQTQVNIY